MPADPQTLALLLADARLPVAGHTQSGGLEPALAAGAVDVPAHLAMRLRTVVRTEAGAAVVARAVSSAGGSLTAVQRAWAARTPSAAMRATSRAQGRALQRLASRLWTLPELPETPARPVVLGALAAAAGLAPDALARVVAYDDVQTVAAASLKLAPRDPAEITGWVVATFGEIDRIVAETRTLTRPEDIPARTAPVLEQHAERHAHTTRRLFSA